MSVTIHISGLNETIEHLEKYKEDLLVKQQTVLQKLGDKGLDVSATRFREAQYDGTNDAGTLLEWVDDHTLLIQATGNAATFIEFGTGVHYSEQHPMAGEYGYTRGGYGKHHGKHDSWYYYGDPGTNGEMSGSRGAIMTHGNPPAMAMYHTGKELHWLVRDVVREVYGL